MQLTRRQLRADSPQAGLSLVEIMVAVGITTVLLMATAATYFGNMKAVAQARSLTEATIFLETVREDLLAQPYGNLLAMNGNSLFNRETPAKSRYRADLTVFESEVGLLQVRLQLVDLQSGAELGKVVTVRSNT
ncbi:MAG: prepilin-type N-terminal cleavage/methylation domain-containing protein [Planctomycetota bacterium]